jgi:hypothetical protein
MNRATLAALERAKDRALALFAQGPHDAATKGLWSGDAKDAYYGALAAAQLLEAGAAHAEKAAAMLAAAEGKLARVESELVALRSEQGALLAVELRRAFDELKAELRDALAPHLPPALAAPSAVRVIKKSAIEYELPCSACGAIAVRWRRGKDQRHGGDDRLVYEGITMATARSGDLAPGIFARLDADDLAGLHAQAKAAGLDEGVDGYCPECDRVYCRVHYQAREVFDEGFYDCTYGTCPQGHRRMIDD